MPRKCGKTAKGSTAVSGLRNTKTMQSTKKGIPKIQSSVYLEMYMLGKEKDRLEKEMFILEKRKGSVQRRLDDVKIEMVKLKEATSERIIENLESSSKDWKKVTLKY